MNFHLINPWTLLGLGLCSLPILIHLLFRMRYQRLQWAAMKFLLAAYRKTKTSLLLENIILLLLRILVIILLTMLFARPAAPEVTKIKISREPDHYIIVVDTSYSMGYRQTNNISCFEKLRQQVQSIWDNAKEKDSMTIITMDERPRVLMSYKEIPLDKKSKQKLFREFEQVGVSEMGIDYALTMDRIKEKVINKRINKRLFIISDFQKASWGKALKNPVFREEIRDLRQHVKSLILVDVGERESENLGIVALEVDGAVGAGIPARFTATIKNYGQRVYHNDLEVIFYPQPRKRYLFDIDISYRTNLNQGDIPSELKNVFQREEYPLSRRAAIKIQKMDSRWTIDEAEKSQSFTIVEEEGTLKVYLQKSGKFTTQEGKQSQRVSLPAEGEQQVAFFHTFDKEQIGNRYVRVELQVDGLVTDNKRYLSFEVLEKIRVLVVDGDPRPKNFESETAYLMPAIGALPGSLIQADKIDLAGMGDIRFDDYDVILLANLHTLARKEQVEQLENFVKKGGGLYIWLGDKVIYEYYNQEMFKDGMGILPAEIKGDPIGIVDVANDMEKTVFQLRGVSKKHPAWHYFIMNPPLLQVLENMLIYRFFPVKVDLQDKSVTVLAYYQNDPQHHPAIIERKLGKGKVILCTTTVDPAWNSMHSDQYGHVFVAIVHEFIQYLGAPAAIEKNLRVGGSFLRRYRQPIENARITTPSQEIKAIEVHHVDEYLFSLSDKTDAREIARGFNRLGIKLHGEISVKKNSENAWIVTTKKHIYRILYDKNFGGISIFQDRDEKPLYTELKVKRYGKVSNILSVYMIDKKNYMVETQDSDTLQSGIYTLDLTLPSTVQQANKALKEYFAINVDPKEGDIIGMPEEKFQGYLKDLDIKYTHDLKQSQELENMQRQIEYWRPFLVLLLIVMAVESFMAMFFARMTR